MTAHVHDLLDRVHQAGARLSLNGDKLRVTTTGPLPDELVEKLKAAKPELIDMLTEPDTQPGTNVVLLAVPDGVPAAWVQGVAYLLSMARPAAWPENQWKLLREDSFAFLRDHGANAARLGWDVLDVFGVHPTRPLKRYDTMGLVVLLNGKRIVELHHDRAIIESQQGQRTRFTRQPAPPARVAVWQLDRRLG